MVFGLSAVDIELSTRKNVLMIFRFWQWRDPVYQDRIRRKLENLSYSNGADSLKIMLQCMLVLGVVGALIGATFEDAMTGSGFGGAVGFVIWVILVIVATRAGGRRGGGRHARPYHSWRDE